jgi:uncharacterized protein (TIGR00266 family)
MHINLINQPGAAAAHLLLDPSEVIYAEAGSMIAMNAETRVKTVTRSDSGKDAQGKKKGGGLLKAMKRMLAGESLFINEYVAGQAGGLLLLAAALPGDLVTLDLGQTGPVVAQGGSFLAYESGVTMDTQFGGAKNLFSGEGLFWLKFGGEGKVLLSSFGAIYEVPVNGEYIVDSGHLVAFQETLTYKMSRSAKGIGSMLGSGEGLVMRFTGQGRLWCQSHHAGSFGRHLGPHLRPSGS